MPTLGFPALGFAGNVPRVLPLLIQVANEETGAQSVDVRERVGSRSLADGAMHQLGVLAGAQGGARSGHRSAAHLDGDPERPVIVGATPNVDTTSLVVDTDATQSRIRTSTGIRFDLEDDA